MGASRIINLCNDPKQSLEILVLLSDGRDYLLYGVHLFSLRTTMIPISNQFVAQNNKALIVASLLIVTSRELQINNLFLTFSANTVDTTMLSKNPDHQNDGNHIIQSYPK